MAVESPKSASWAEVLGEGRLPAFILICMGVWLYAADSLVTATIMPSVGKALGGYAWFGWATAGYLLGSVVAGASSGLLAQRFGLRKATAAAAILYAAGCALSASAPEMGTFLGGRIIQGIAGGWVSGFCSVAIGLLFPNRCLARVYAAITSVWGVATLLGPLVGGLFAGLGEDGWRWVFWSFSAQALAVAAAAWFLLPRGETGNNATKIAWTQLALVLVGVALIGFADRTGDVAKTAALALLGVAVLIATAHFDGRAKARMLPTGAMDQKTAVGAGYAVMFLSTAASMGYGVYGPIILQTLKGYTPLEAGYVVAIEALAWTISGLAISHLTGPWPKRLIRIGGVLVLFGVAGSALAFPTANLAGVLIAGIVMGMGFGLSWAFTAQAIVTALPEPERGIGSGGITAVRLTGSAAGAAAAAAVANLVGLAHAPTVQAAGDAGFWIFVILTPVGMLAMGPVWRLSRPS